MTYNFIESFFFYILIFLALLGVLRETSLGEIKKPLLKRSGFQTIN